MSQGAPVPGILTAEDRRFLLRLARETLAAHLAGGRAPRPPAEGELARPLGAFVTLVTRERGALRGCMGTMSSDAALVDTIAAMAVAAGTRDPRFAAVEPGELSGLLVEISVLGPLRQVRPDEVEVGRDGLLVTRAGRRGVLLPQVAVEHGWDRERFLAHTCLKAGLPEGAWRENDTRIEAFTATVFGEHDQGDPALR